MQSTLDPAHNDPCDVLEIAPDIVLVARAEQELSKLARDAKARDVKTRAPQPQPKAGPTPVEDPSVPPIDTAFRATAVTRNRPSSAGRAIRGFVGVLLAVLVGGAALTLKVSGDVAQQVLAAWVPHFAARATPPDNEAPQDQSAVAVQQAATAQPAAPTAATPPPPPADTTAQTSVAPTAAAAAPPDQAQMLQSMAHHLANVGQELEALKAQVAELKASQEQMSRDMAKATEKAAEQKLKLSALPPRPATVPPRRPPPTFRPAQAAMAPVAPPPPSAYVPPPQAAAPYPPPPVASTYAPPPQAAPQVYDPNAPRPPMPVRE